MVVVNQKCITTYCNNTLSPSFIEYRDDDFVKMEYTLYNGGRADIAIINNTKIRYIFEIYSTSRTEKKGWYMV